MNTLRAVMWLQTDTWHKKKEKTMYLTNTIPAVCPIIHDGFSCQEVSGSIARYMNRESRYLTIPGQADHVLTPVYKPEGHDPPIQSQF